MHPLIGQSHRIFMTKEEMFLRMRRGNEAREWLDEMGIVLAPATLDDCQPQIEYPLEELGIEQAPSGKSGDDHGERAA